MTQAPMRGPLSSRRAVVGAATVVGLFAVSLTALLFHQVSREGDAFLREQRAHLAERLKIAVAGLELLEDAALRDLGRALDEGPAARRRAEDAHPLVARSFLVAAGGVRWPAPAAGSAAYVRSLWENGATPLARRLLGEVHARLAGGEREEACTELDRLQARPLPAPALAEAALLRAAVLAREPEELREAVGSCERVLELAAGESALGQRRGELLPWLLAARFRAAELLIALGERAAGAGRLLDLVAELAGGEEPRPAGLFADFYIEEAIAHLEPLGSSGALAPPEAERLARLRALVERCRAEEGFRKELEALWLPALRAAEIERGRLPRRIYLRTPAAARLLVARRESGDPDRTVGFLADLARLRERLTASLASLPPAGAESPLRVLDGEGRPVFGPDPAAAPAVVPGGGGTISVPFGGDLPWTVELAAHPALRSFRARRFLVYGGLAVVILAAVTAATATTLRAMARQVELAETQSRFVANVSHELKTPLTLIRMFADLLLLGYAKSDAEKEGGLRVIARESETLAVLIDNILDIHRIESGEKEYHLEVEEPGPLVRRAVEELAPYLEHKGFTVQVDIAADLPPVALDRLAFRQALRNLLANAVKFSREPREVEVRARRDGERLAVEVADRGVGLAPGDLRRVFERFYRARGPGVEAAGAGIGLAIVRHIAEGHGGEASAANRAGGGCVFTLRFPAAAAAGPQGPRGEVAGEGG